MYSDPSIIVSMQSESSNVTSLFEHDWPSRYKAWISKALPELQAKRWSDGFQDYPWLTYEDTPWVPWRKSLSAARVALVTSGGLTLAGQPPFRAEDPEGDNSYRLIEGPGPLKDWEIHHGHYDPAGALRDYNTVFPLDVLQELTGNLIGEVARRHVSFMGFQTNIYDFFTSSAVEIVDIFQEDAVDTVLLVPV